MEISNRISAQIIADSINTQGDRITTFVLTFPRIVLAEFNTHRAISKNSASSRAIPFQTMLKMVQEQPFVPIAFQKEHKGMQGSAYFTENHFVDVTPPGEPLGATNSTVPAIEYLQASWLKARDKAVSSASELSKVGLTKQLCNRILEPYLYHTVICTGTEWENFFALRAHPDAEIHIADLAQKMLDVYNSNTPKLLLPGEWHIPFGDSFDLIRLNQMVGDAVCSREEFHEQCAAALASLKVKIATARCARVSYLNFEGKDDYKADIVLYSRLLESGHMSPFEHCAMAMTEEEYFGYSRTESEPYGFRGPIAGRRFDGYSGNFKGFVQHRKMLAGENKSDPRVTKHNG